jgi:hypothetical protein
MSVDTINCPRCNSEEKFKKKFRRIGTRPWLEVYVACSLCRWENVLGKTSQEIEDTKARIAVIAQKKAREEMLHGHCSQSMLNIEARADALLRAHESALRKVVRDYGSSAD